VQQVPQRGDAVGDQLVVPGQAEQRADGEHVRHPGGDVRLHRPVELGAAALVQPGKPTVRVPRRRREPQHPPALRIQLRPMPRSPQHRPNLRVVPFLVQGGGGVSVTASEARQRLFPLIEEVNEDQVAVEIVSKKGTAFLVSADEYRSLKETVYLLQSPRNAERLRESIAQLRRGEAGPHELSEPG
jgi:antitoxin YefM